jgi:uncharacterized protein (TIGR02444 family)
MREADHPHPQPADAPLWTFAVNLYGAPGVAEACLALQDRYGCDVNVLLFAAWMGAAHHHTLSSVELAEAAATVQHWHAEIVRPLRSVRRRLKSGPPPARHATTEALRARVKSVELEAERIELAMLEALAARAYTRGSTSGGESLANLEVAVRYFSGGEVSAEALGLIRVIEKGLNMHIAVAAPE